MYFIFAISYCIRNISRNKYMSNFLQRLIQKNVVIQNMLTQMDFWYFYGILPLIMLKNKETNQQKPYPAIYQWKQWVSRHPLAMIFQLDTRSKWPVALSVLRFSVALSRMQDNCIFILLIILCACGDEPDIEIYSKLASWSRQHHTELI